MASTAAGIVTWIFPIFLLSCTAGQHLSTAPSNYPAGICQSIYCSSVICLQKLNNCVVILGNLRILLMERTNTSSFQNISFPNLREVTGFVVIYRVIGLESLGLFPNLTRIRGQQLINNYALVVHDMPNLKEVGLYSLLKIDRGGVIIWGGPHTCYVDTIDWNAIAPRSRHMLTYPEMTAHCKTSKPCKCSVNNKNNFCWSSSKCQRFISGPKAESCYAECLGCRYRKDECSVCRHYTYQGRCVSSCPPHNIILPNNQYCITIEECQELKGWSWNKTCVFECPLDYNRTEENGVVTCERCWICQKTCSSLVIDSLNRIQQADRCVYIAGSLTIHVRSVPVAVDELQRYLSIIEEVTDYIVIYGSVSMKSLEFLSSLRSIGGKQLKDNAYSLIIHDMKNLQTLFTNDVMRQLEIHGGKLKIYGNPKLCMNKVNELKLKFPIKSNDTDIPLGMNGYSGGCEDSIELQVQVLNETAAQVKFTPHNDPNVKYTVLYARVTSGSHADLTPETCSKSEWFAVPTKIGTISLTSLRPASTYIVCVETYLHSNPLESYLARTTMINFTTPFIKPEPPFVQEVVAFSPNTVALRWMNHKDYRDYITSYQLDVTLIDIEPKNLKTRDHCNLNHKHDLNEDYSRHTMVYRTPHDYENCEPACSTLTTIPENLMEDYFDVCGSLDSECNYYEDAPPKNSSYKKFVRTLALDLYQSKTVFQVDGLAPFRDYRIRLRACAGKKCSRSRRVVIRTLRSIKADYPSIAYSTINDSGHMSIKWEPPDETNGPLLAYNIHVLPVEEKEISGIAPDVWCVYPDQQIFSVKLKVTKLKVRVCSTTLGSYSACSDWHQVSVQEIESGLLLVVVGGVFFSISLIAFSVALGFFFDQRRSYNDQIPLVDITSMYRNESDPPNVVTLNDFLPLYSMPLSEALLDY